MTLHPLTSIQKVKSGPYYYKKKMSICDLIKEEGKNIVVENQRDWKVPNFSASTLNSLCHSVNCDAKCKKCLVTRIGEELEVKL